LGLYLTVFAIASSGLICIFIDKSPRYLILIGEIEKCVILLDKMGYMNNKENY